MSFSKSKKIKNLGLLGLTLTLVIPTMTLTSCGKVSQYYLPVLVGGPNKANSPFRNADTSIKDANNNNTDYIPSNYDYYLNPSSTSSSTTLYSYAQPYDLSQSDLDPSNLPKMQEEWYSSNDQNAFRFTYTTKDSSDETKKINHFAARNYNIGATTSAVNSISSNASTLLSYMLFYQLHMVDGFIADNDHKTDDLKKMYGGNVTGLNDLTSASAKKFLEFNYDLSNSISSSKSKLKFGQSACDIEVLNTGLGSNHFGFLTNYADKTNMLDTSYPYAETKQDPDDDTKQIVSSYRSIPFLFNVNNLTFNWYNPTPSNKDFLPNNWLITDKSKVDNAVSNSKTWNKFFDITGQTTKEVSSLNMKINIENSSISTSDFSFDKFNKEPSLKNLINGTNIYNSTFVGLASYTLYTITNDQDGTEVKEKIPVFTGVTGIYPLYFLLDENVYSPKSKDDTSVYFLDSKKLEEKESKLIQFLTDRKSDPTSDLNGIKYFFSKKNGNDWTCDVNSLITY